MELTLDEKKRLLDLLKEQEDRVRFNKFLFFKPYAWQSQFIEATKENSQVLAMTGNRCGKTITGAYSTSCHATGEYPADWEGRRFDHPVDIWVCGASTNTVRDILQSELLGKWTDPTLFGTGMIPKRCIDSTINKIGTPGAYEVVRVKHISGGISTITFKTYEMDLDKFMGTSIHVVWLDEEAPREIFTQCITRTLTAKGITYLTFTPEKGLTELVHDFMYDLKPKQALITATWNDAPHLDKDSQEQLLSVYSAAERDMRSTGMPFLGQGVCFPVNKEKLIVKPFTVPDHWLKLIGIDLGYDHPNGCAVVALDQETGTYYLVDEYSERKQTVPMHSQAIVARGGNRIPVQLPHDSFKSDGASSGQQFIQLYRNEGVNCLPRSFSNPSLVADKSGGNSVEFGVHFMLKLMEEGKFKVFDHCQKFLNELTSYHRKDGKIVAKFDDMISATRYAVLSIERFGVPGSLTPNSYHSQGSRLEPEWIKGIV